jgi:DNA-binding MarR family transcriptional regulator
MARRAPIKVGKEIEREFPGADAKATAAVVNLLRTVGSITNEFSRRFRAYGLSPATFNVLMILRGEGGPLSPCVVSERLLVTRGTVTGLLDSLEKQGLIRRTPHPEDRRMLLVEITPAGTTLLKKILPAHYQGERELLSCLSGAEKDTLIKLLGKVQAAAGGSEA